MYVRKLLRIKKKIKYLILYSFILTDDILQNIKVDILLFKYFHNNMFLYKIGNRNRITNMKYY